MFSIFNSVKISFSNKSVQSENVSIPGINANNQVHQCPSNAALLRPNGIKNLQDAM
jgi:hypothetical protein